MKINGTPVSQPEPELLVLPRNNQNLAFYAQSVDWSDFVKKYPEPNPPMRLIKNVNTPDLTDVNYQRDFAAYCDRRQAYLIIKSLEPSKIEWDTVNIEDPSTWSNYQTDLVNAGFSTTEINRIILLVHQANSLDEAKLEQARKVFLQGQAQA